MRYYDVPDRPIVDPDGNVRPTRVSRFAGGPKSTRFVDPETGVEYRAIRVDVNPTRGWFGYSDPAGYPVDFRYPVDPGLKWRTRKDGTVRPIGWMRAN